MVRDQNVARMRFYLIVCGFFFRITSSAISNALPKFSPAFMLVIKTSFSVVTLGSTSPVGVCLYGVSYINFICWFLQTSLNIRPVNAVASSVLIVSGTLFRFIYTLFQKHYRCLAFGFFSETGFLLFLNRSIQSKLHIQWFILVIGPMKSNWISSFGLLSGGNCFVFVLG